MFENAVFAGFRQAFLHPLDGLFILDRLHQRLDIDAGVPHFQHGHRAEFRHVLAVRSHATQHGIAGVVFAEAIVAAGQDKARGQALQIPLPRGRQRLVQVVDVEDDAPFGSGECAEIHQVTVTAGLHADP